MALQDLGDDVDPVKEDHELEEEDEMALRELRGGKYSVLADCNVDNGGDDAAVSGNFLLH